jgi:transcriptional regulator with XRE-family HTH domain
VKIVRHRAATVDDLRERLKGVLGKPKRRPCPTCAGSGHVNTPLTQTEVAQELGLSPKRLSTFVTGKGKLTLERGLQLLAWLEEVDRDPLAEADAEHKPVAPGYVEHRESPRMRQLRDVSLAAASEAAIDAKDRPIQFRQRPGS